MRRSMDRRQVEYTVENRTLVRTVTGADGRQYVQRCCRDTFEQVAHHIDELPSDSRGTSQEAMVRELGLPHTQVSIALEFLKERGCVEVRGRRSYPASRCTYEDAMVEFHALAFTASQKHRASPEQEG